MDLAARPHITAGVALASAAILAAGPMAQHLPGLHVTQQLRQLSVSDIQLTDASSGMMDLFAGMENQLASLASSGAAAAAVPGDVVSSITGNLVVQTWNDAYQTVVTNLPVLASEWLADPFPVLQQIGDNWVGYANAYVSAYQQAGLAAVKTFGPNGTAWQAITNANAILATGSKTSISTALNLILSGWISGPFIGIGAPLEGILRIPSSVLANVSNLYNWTISTPTFSSNNLLSIVGDQLASTSLSLISKGIGPSLNSALQAWNAGNPTTALTYLLNTPGAFVDALLKGVPQSATRTNLINGLLTLAPTGWLQHYITFGQQTFGPGMAAPGATTVQQFVNTLTNGWSPMINTFSTQLTAMLQSLPSFVSNLPSMISNFGGALAGQIGLLIANLLKLL
ncbi:hypothetical protein H7H82_17900 [Mycobacterium heidelbergense]|uniref:hypothetical protein n=1 Tax=Mycobacterium heidelbergense TaxID=53376 RepID=UPI00114D8566|nr:hypothetical protein [Mycobacterium heidelbergense]MCV7052443.1 hypothetical protein [Mycobacterium heidelbergense]BBZ50432.1 hypothetical protein MHEI_21490 [Mycobacterium heidelbergense]